MEMTEVRALIVDDQTEKFQKLEAQIESLGGEVVARAANVNEAFEFVTPRGETDPIKEGGINVVFMDGTIEIGKTKGSGIFIDGFISGRLHPATGADNCIGPVTVGYSGDENSSIARATGFNYRVGRVDVNELVDALAPHTANPLYMPFGYEQNPFKDRTMSYELKHGPYFPANTKKPYVAHFFESSPGVEIEKAVVTSELGDNSEINPFGEDEPGTEKFLNFMIEQEGRLFIAKYVGRMEKIGERRHVDFRVIADTIDPDHIDNLPEGYWSSMEIPRPS